MNGRWSDLPDEALSRRLASDLPRYTAPAALRARLVAGARPSRRARAPWLAPALSALATAALLVLFVLPTLPRTTPADAASRLLNAVVAEHTRVLMWGARRADIIPAAAEEAGIQLVRAFAGDDTLDFVNAEPVYLDWRRGIALHYRDAEDHRLTYVVLPAPGMPMPDRFRMQVGQFRPALMRAGGFASWVWKQGELACFLVSDLTAESDLPSFKDYFVRVRAATEPRSID